MSSPRICDLGTAARNMRAAWPRARALGFNYIAADDGAALSDSSLPVIANVHLSETSTDDPFVVAHPDWFAVRHAEDPAAIIDPRDPTQIAGIALARVYMAPDAFRAHWRDRLALHCHQGIKGFRLRHPQRIPPAIWTSLLKDLRRDESETLFIADIAGLMRTELLALEGCGFDYCLSSAAWWDFRSPWLVEEYEAASTIASVIATVAPDARSIPANVAERRARYAVAAVAGSGVWAPFEYLLDDEIDACVIKTNGLIEADEIVAARGALLRCGQALIRTREPDQRLASDALVAILNPDDVVSLSPVSLEDWEISVADTLAPRGAQLVRASRRGAIRREPPVLNADASRVVIANISPCVDDGCYPVKRIVGDTVVVEADIFADGHPLLAAELVLLNRRVPMRLIENDRWRASFVVDCVGLHEFTIEAWIDRYGGFARDLSKKDRAGRDIALDLREGEAMTRHALGVSVADTRVLLAPETLEAMRRVEPRHFLKRSAPFAIDGDRKGAVFASWYELFPRSQTTGEAHHGTFRDVLDRLGDIRAMGFDVLYFPPIHPIGKTNRKGRNNALTPGADDPGSVYAIGSAEGGHDAVHPDLGTLDDFRALVVAARAHGLEIALDFAVQCSPDHPWLKEHPGWFDWRADGSIKYAENPPKLYEDIVNVDFYAKDAIPELWIALRDIVRLWAGEGVRIFRVDNPHTKPFAFWQWLIESIRASDPDVIFLAEAFTRPTIMYHLAKIGFTQSYTYFTWRNTKEELTEYLEELNEEPVCDFFRPHFFVNTPDINPHFLQTSGRPGFLIRAALAATLSGLWGVYSGFEICEAAALPGREEYSDSEKYQIKPRSWSAPGNINAEIATLNRLRKAYPALQTHLGVTFYNAFNPNILYYGKHVPGEASRILVAVNLDPHTPQECDFESPLWEWALPDNGALFAEDLLTGRHAVWRGKIQHLRLEPDAPYRIWRVCPAEE